MRKSGKADTLLFLIFRIFPKSKFLMAAESMETSKLDSPQPPSPTPTNGPAERLERFHRAMLALISGRYAVSPATYRTIFFRSSGRSAVSPHFFTQALAFTKELSLSIPRPREPASPSEPSSLQPNKGFAATTQFPPGMSGEIPGGGILPLTAGITLKHAATPMAPVMVGVI